MDKPHTFRRTFALASAAFAAVVAACAGNTGSSALVRTSAEPPGPNCANGGTMLETGIDTNGNGMLDPGEVNASQTTYICNGASAEPTLIATTPEPAGQNCPFGGIRVDMGVDANGNGVLDPSEVNPAQTTYVCG